jgi:hypothetical protein
MRHFLSTFLAFHWAVAFALLAAACVSVGEGNAGALGLIGWTATGLPDGILGVPTLAAVLALCFATVSVLFLWALLTTFFGSDRDSDEQVIKTAFGGACCALTLVLVLGAVEAATGFFPVVAAVLAALLASYVAICAERLSASISDIADEDDIQAAARVMAAGAAHSSMLSRLSGRADLKPDGGR